MEFPREAPNRLPASTIMIHMSNGPFLPPGQSFEKMQSPSRPHYHWTRNISNCRVGEASNLGCKDIGFCLLSCGVFRGSEPLGNLIELALDVIVHYCFKEDSSLEHWIQKVVFVAYTQEEQEVRKRQVKESEHVSRRRRKHVSNPSTYVHGNI
ncbi:unnamed protein product [Cylindrotheca closterium]|uniref:Uncharacterized protein n=1 Tax=Cylindrotheca closterium TaxID=2856 RepID=A0AAD2CBK7_9STRA|nr:unnamed protein product [Cylindrotheca closterium]